MGEGGNVHYLSLTIHPNLFKSMKPSGVTPISCVQFASQTLPKFPFVYPRGIVQALSGTHSSDFGVEPDNQDLSLSPSKCEPYYKSPAQHRSQKNINNFMLQGKCRNHE